MAKYLHFSPPNIWSRSSGDIQLGVSRFCVSFQKIYRVIDQKFPAKNPLKWSSSSNPHLRIKKKS